MIAACLALSCGDREPTPAAKPAAPPAEPASPATPDRARVHAFCVASFDAMYACVDDAAFWNVMATLYFQSDPQLAGNDAAKEPWIDMMKSVATKLHDEGAYADNCNATLDHNLWPTEEQMRRVEAARAVSCGDFGSAFGYMMFGEGAFHRETHDHAPP